jgi:hypothetical protein
MRIDVIHLRGLQQRGDGCPGPATAVAANEERIFSCDGLRPDGPLEGAGVHLDAAVTQETLEGDTSGCGIGSPRRAWSRRGSSFSHRSKSGATMAADFSWRTFTRVAGSWRLSASEIESTKGGF